MALQSFKNYCYNEDKGLYSDKQSKVKGINRQVSKKFDKKPIDEPIGVSKKVVPNRLTMDTPSDRHQRRINRQDH